MRRCRPGLPELPTRSALPIVDVARGEESDHALIEAEVLDWILNLPFLDVPDAVARQTRLQRDARIDAADVPEAAEQYPAVHRLDHVFNRNRRLRTLDDAVDWTRRRFLAFLFRPEARINKVLNTPLRTR